MTFQDLKQKRTLFDRNIVLTCIMIVFPILSHAQSVYLSGYFINIVGDTTKGYIEYSERAINPDKISFKKALSDKNITELSSDNTREVVISGFDIFEALNINISMDSRKLSELSFGPDSSSRNEIVFLKQIAIGPKLILYSYKDKLKERYYISSPDGSPKELIYKIYQNLNIQNQVREDKIYQRQLMTECLKAGGVSQNILSSLPKISYTSSDIKQVINAINGVSNEKEDIAKKNKYIDNHVPAIPLRLFIGTGVEAHFLKVNNNNHSLAGAKNELTDNVNLFFRGGIDIFNNQYLRKSGYRIEVNYASAKNFLSKTTDSYSLNKEDTLRLNWNTIGLSMQLFKRFPISKTSWINFATGLQAELYKYKESGMKTSYFGGVSTNYTDYSHIVVNHVFSIPFSISAEVKNLELFCRYKMNISPYTKYKNEGASSTDDSVRQYEFRGKTLQCGIVFSYDLQKK